MKKREVIKKKEDFNKIIQTCPYKKNKYFTLYIRKRTISEPCFGLAISKKVGNAVVRNKLKRQIRYIIDQNKVIFSKDSDYIIMIKKNCNNIHFPELEKSLLQLVKEKK